jgi:hypothetical protein
VAWLEDFSMCRSSSLKTWGKQQYSMNENSVSAGRLSEKADISRRNTHVGTQQIGNGFVLNWYDGGAHNVFCESLDEVKSKLEEIFAK